MKTKQQVLAYSFILMVIYIKVSLVVTEQMVMVNTFIKTELFIMAYGIMILNMILVMNYGMTVQHTQVYI